MQSHDRVQALPLSRRVASDHGRAGSSATLDAVGAKASRMGVTADVCVGEENEEVVLAWATREQEQRGEEVKQGYKYSDGIRVQCRRWRCQ